MKLKRLGILVGLLIGALFLTFGCFSNSDGTSTNEIIPHSTYGETYTITLITGDQIIVDEYDDGELSLDIFPAERDGYEPGFKKLEIDENIYVFPEDVLVHIPDKIDRELFNITRLANEGYKDEEMEYIPLIITFKEQTSMNGMNKANPSLDTVLMEQKLFSSINGISAKVDKDQAESFNKFLFEQNKNSLNSTGFLENSIEQIRLDRMFKAALENSIPQIGAEQAWSAGYDGTGVKVAVLDTGIDREHPDMEGKIIEERNFSLDDGVIDLHGHGTHVASTIAGSGAASNGARKGVAPGSQLLIAKVLGADGRGLESGIIAAMEWSANQGADIINMSLGSGPSDGTDPVSQAVNAITKEHGVLFVVAVGNDGPLIETASAPATADSALAVGSVDKWDYLAISSSRGPRINDFAIKPEITAPGVSINAARAQNTSMGIPINDFYTAASGTSMAAPHVSGAAALLIEKWNEENKEVSPDSVKSTLVSTAIPHEDFSVYNQGGGRVDVSRALTQEVFVEEAPLNMGYFTEPYNEQDPVTKNLTLHNRSDTEVVLDLSFEIEAPGTNPLPDEIITFSKKQVVLNPGEMEKVGVTVDPKYGDTGLYGGYIKAESIDGDALLHIPTGFYKEPELYDLTIKGITYNGREAQYPSAVDVMNVKDAKIFFEPHLFSWNSAGEQVVRVPEGKYSVMGILHSYVDLDPDSKPELTEMVMVGEPEFEVNKDMTIVLDARGANEITVDLEEDANLDFFAMTYHRTAEDRGSATVTYNANGIDIYAVPTDPVNTGEFEFYTEWRFTSSDKSQKNSPFVYNLVYPENTIPANLSYNAQKEDLAQVNHKYYGHNEVNYYNVFRHKWRPYTLASISVATEISAPTEQVEYYVPSDTRYRKNVSPIGSGFSFREAMVTYPEKGQLETSWLKQPMHPGVLLGNPPYDDHTPVYRENNILNVLLPEYLDSENHWSLAPGGSKFRLYKDDQLISQANQARGIFQLSPDEAQYRIELVVDGEKRWSPFSTMTRTNWTFHSEKPDGPGRVSVPLLLLNYNKELNLDNSDKLPSDLTSPNILDIKVSHQPGVENLAVEGAKLWISYNDGENWKAIGNIQHLGDGHFQANLDRGNHHDGSGYVSLKVEAWDTEQNKVEQEIIRAYKLSDRNK